MGEYGLESEGFMNRKIMGYLLLVFVLFVAVMIIGGTLSGCSHYKVGIYKHEHN